MLQYEEFKNKVAIVTGVASGCGKAIALALLKNGAKVVFLDIDFPAAQNAILELDEETQGKAVAFKVDVSNSHEVRGAIPRIVDKFGGIDYLVNNAGISEVDFIQNVKEEDWDRVMDVNAKGTFLMTQAVTKYWTEQKANDIKDGRILGGSDHIRGVIVNVVSESVFSHHGMGTVYNASKAAQRAITKTSARELIKYGIRVNAVHPSIVEGTKLTAYLNEKFKKEWNWTEEEARKMYLSKIPAGRFCTVDDVARVTLFLLSEESSFVVGADIHCSGGQAI